MSASLGKTEWQIRAREAGLTQKQLALLLGLAQQSVSMQLRGHLRGGVPRYVSMFILAWHRLSAEHRAELTSIARSWPNVPETVRNSDGRHRAH